jgi:pimeloyl-ACP methyl ester carboxylesterase
MGDVSVAFYGDLFRPPGSRSTRLPEYDASDVDDLFERELLYAWWQETARIDHAVPGPDDPTRVRTPHWVQRALYALSGSSFFGGVAERVMIGSLKQVSSYFTDQGLRLQIRQRVLDTIDADTAIVVAHSLGSVVAYEALCDEPDTPVTTLVTVGSPLGLRNLIFDRLIPSPKNDRGSWPGNVSYWTNIADRDDIVALAKKLAPLFGMRICDVVVHNGVRAHDIRPYLTARETGLAVLKGMRAQ